MAAKLGRVCREHRERREFTLMDVATEAGVSQTTVHNFEHGDRWVRDTDEIVDAYARLSATTSRALWLAAIDRN